MRLLQRQDWVGLAASSPVNMHFSSSEEKDKIGKRRKIGRRPARYQKSSEPPRWETFHYTEGNHPRPYMSGALPKKRDEDIRIRIGTDALTTRISMQHSDHAQLQTTAPYRTPSFDPMSDTMLFDNEHLYAAPEELVQHARVASPKYSMPVGLSTGVRAVSPYAPFRGERALEQSGTHRKHPRISYGRKEVGATEMGPNQQTPGEDPTFYIAHHVGGVECHLRLVFDRPSDTLHVGGATDTANAGLMTYEREKVNQDNRDHRISDADGARPPSIVDDGRGKSFLAIPDDSSCCSTMEGRPRSGLSRSPQLQPMTTIVEVEFAQVSQHATIGDQPRISTSSPVSASLPSIKSSRQSEQRTSRDQDQSARRIKKREEWQSFAREGGNDLESDTMHGESSIEMCSVRSSPRLIPSSLAIASRISDNVQEAAHRKPHSTPSECISSPEDSEMYAQELSEADKRAGGPCLAEHSIYSEEESLIQASIINNVSHNMDTTLSRNGSGRSCGSDFGPALAKRSEFGRLTHESPMYYIPQNDSEGIDLVDSERLW
jgi:hypothetical protein